MVAVTRRGSLKSPAHGACTAGQVEKGATKRALIEDGRVAAAVNGQAARRRSDPGSAPEVIRACRPGSPYNTSSDETSWQLADRGALGRPPSSPSARSKGRHAPDRVLSCAQRHPRP